MTNLQVMSIGASMMAAAHYIRGGSADMLSVSLWLVAAGVYCLLSELTTNRAARIAGQRGDNNNAP